MQTNEKTFGVHNLFGSCRAELHAAQAKNGIFLQVTDANVHDLQLFDTTFMEISGGPFPLHPPPFSGVQNYKFNKLIIFSAYYTNSLAHLRRAIYIKCTLGILRAAERGQGANCPRAPRHKGPHNTTFFTVWGPHKVNLQ